eukprot:345-Heterococcus_DN1.PRE.1
MLAYVGKAKRNDDGFLHFKGDSNDGQSIVVQQTGGHAHAPDRGSQLLLHCTHTAVDGLRSSFDLQATLVQIEGALHKLSSLDSKDGPSATCTMPQRWHKANKSTSVTMHISLPQ